MRFPEKNRTGAAIRYCSDRSAHLPRRSYENVPAGSIRPAARSGAGRCGLILSSGEIIDGASKRFGDPEDISQRRIADLAVGYLFDGFIGNGRPVGQRFERPVVPGQLRGYTR